MYSLVFVGDGRCTKNRCDIHSEVHESRLGGNRGQHDAVTWTCLSLPSVRGADLRYQQYCSMALRSHYLVHQSSVIPSNMNSAVHREIFSSWQRFHYKPTAWKQVWIRSRRSSGYGNGAPVPRTAEVDAGHFSETEKEVLKAAFEHHIARGSKGDTILRHAKVTQEDQRHRRCIWQLFPWEGQQFGLDDNGSLRISSLLLTLTNCREGWRNSVRLSSCRIPLGKKVEFLLVTEQDLKLRQWVDGI